MFYIQSKSWLSFQQKIETSNGKSNMTTMFGVDKIPTDNLVSLIAPSLSANFQPNLQPTALYQH